MVNSIRRRLLTAFIALGIVPLLMLGTIVVHQSYQAGRRQGMLLQRQMANDVMLRFDRILSGAAGALDLGIKYYQLKHDVATQRLLVFRLLMAGGEFDRILLLDAAQRPQAHISRLGLSSDGTVGATDLEVAAAVQETGGDYYGPVRFDEAAGEPLIAIAKPIVDIRTGKMEGILIADVRLKVLWDSIAAAPVLPGQSVYIVDARGRLVAHANPSLVLSETVMAVPAHDGIWPGLSGEKTVMARKTLQYGQQTFVAVAEQKTADAFSLAFGLVRLTVFLVLLALAAAAVLGAWVLRQIVHPIQEMAGAARIITAGDLTRQVAIRRSDEIGVLADAFNAMTDQLRGLIERLEKKVAERTAQLESAQAELLRQERLAALGKVSATIAHEVLNPLGTVNTSLYSIRVALERNQPDKIRRAMVLADRNIRRCSTIINELVDYTDKRSIKPQTVLIDRWVGEVLDQQLVPPDVSIRRRLMSGVTVSMDPDRARRALAHILTNAVQAVGDQKGTLREVAVDVRRRERQVEVCVTDTGPGIPDEIREKIHAPLFSTKTFGVGLGLCIASDTMAAHGGGIDIASTPGKGTTVVLWFPCDRPPPG